MNKSLDRNRDQSVTLSPMTPERLAMAKANQAAWCLAHPGRVGPEGDLPTWGELSETAKTAWGAGALAALERAPFRVLLRALFAKLFAPLLRRKAAT